MVLFRATKRVNASARRLNLVFVKDEDRPEQGRSRLPNLGQHDGRPVAGRRDDMSRPLVEVQQLEGDAELGHHGVPGPLAAHRRMRDVAQRAVGGATHPSDEIRQLTADPAVSSIDADQPFDSAHRFGRHVDHHGVSVPSPPAGRIAALHGGRTPLPWAGAEAKAGRNRNQRRLVWVA